MYFLLKEDFSPRVFYFKDFFHMTFLVQKFRTLFNNVNFSRLVNPSKEEKEFYLHQEPVDVHIPTR